MFLENWNQHFQEVNQPGKLNREQCACQNQPIFASIIVCNLKFRSLIHFQFIFTYDGRKCFNFTLLHVANQFFQHQLQKTLSFPYCMFLLLLSQINWPYVSGLFLGSLFCSADLCDCFFVPVLSCFDYCSFVVQSEVRKSVIPSAFFSPPDCFYGLLRFHINFRIICCTSVKNTLCILGILIMIALNLQIALSSMDSLAILLLPIHEQGCLSGFFCIIFSCLYQCSDCQEYRSLPQETIVLFSGEL